MDGTSPGGPWDAGTGPPAPPPPPASWPPAPQPPWTGYPPGPSYPGYPGYPGHDPRRRFRLRAVVLAGIGGLLGGLALAVAGLALVAVFAGDLLAPGVVAGTHEGVEAAGGPAVGDCLDDGPSSVDLADSTQLVDCTLRHGSEVIAVAALPDTSDRPDATDVDFFADGVCRVAYRDYVGGNYDTAALFFEAVVPSDRAWDGGERRVFCLLDSDGYRDGRGSARGSG